MRTAACTSATQAVYHLLLLRSSIVALHSQDRPLHNPHRDTFSLQHLDENEAFSEAMICKLAEFPIETEHFSKQGFPVVPLIRHSVSKEA